MLAIFMGVFVRAELATTATQVRVRVRP